MKKFIYLTVALSALFFGGQVFAACQATNGTKDYPTLTLTIYNKTAHHYLLGPTTAPSSGTCQVCNARSQNIPPGESGTYKAQCSKPFSGETLTLGGFTLQAGSSISSCGPVNIVGMVEPIQGAGYGLLLSPTASLGCGGKFKTSHSSVSGVYYKATQTITIEDS